MVKINYEQVKQRIMNHGIEEKHFLIEGNRGSGKTTLAIEKYKNMIEVQKISSREILILFMNKYQSLGWMEGAIFGLSNGLRKSSYISFVQRELNRHWPMVLENATDRIHTNSLGPKFASFDVAHHMMKLLIEHFRKKKGYLAEVNSTAPKIARDFIRNMNQAALSLIPFDEIGYRIHGSIEIRNLSNGKIYDQMDEIIGHYGERFIEKGVLDDGLSIYIYHHYLLKDEQYLQRLRKEVKHLIVDNLEEASAAEIAFINQLIPHVNTCYLFYNPEGGISRDKGVDMAYIEQNLKRYKVKLKLEEHFLTKDTFVSFCDILEDATLYQREDAPKVKVSIYTDLSSQLRSQMIHRMKERVISLIDEGENPKDIFIITPFLDIFFVREMEKALLDKGVGLFCTSRQDRLMDNPYVHSMVVLAYLCKGYKKGILTEDDYRNLFSVVLSLDYIKAGLLGKAVEKEKAMVELHGPLASRMGPRVVEKYNRLKEWIGWGEHRNLPLDELFRRIYWELLMPLDHGKKHMGICGKVIGASEQFLDIFNNFEMAGSHGERFIELVKGSMMNFIGSDEITEGLSSKNHITMTTPTTFIQGNMESKIQLWGDVSSEGWLPRNIKEFTNPHVLRATWDKGMIYSDSLEDQQRTRDMIKISKALLKKCRDKIYMFGSEYGVGGFEQQSMFLNTMMDALDKVGDENGI